MIKIFNKNEGPALSRAEGFSLVEIIVSLAIFALILFVIISFFLSMNTSNSKTKIDGEALESAREALDQITYEIRSAKSVYTPTTTENQLSLETFKYVPDGERSSFIDFFLCGTAVCVKKESQVAVALTPSSVQVTGLTFSQILTSTSQSIQVNIIVGSTSLTSTASLRSY
jgi:prepilin-type N-terminal cleavage/methylation domain-containing protein